MAAIFLASVETAAIVFDESSSVYIRESRTSGERSSHLLLERITRISFISEIRYAAHHGKLSFSKKQGFTNSSTPSNTARSPLQSNIIRQVEMDQLARTIDTAIQNNDYPTLYNVFLDSNGPAQWHQVGQGEQRSVAAHFVAAAVASPNFLPRAFESEEVVQVMSTALQFLPSVVENAADNKLRQMLFEHKVQKEGDYAGAARILIGMRMEDDPSSVYYMDAAAKCDVHVKVAECFLAEDLISESDSAVNKAGTVLESIKNPEEHVSLILRYKSTYARILDANRKFLQAAQRYHDLSQSSTDAIDAEDLLQMLGRAATCAILAPESPQRRRILGHVSRRWNLFVVSTAIMNLFVSQRDMYEIKMDCCRSTKISDCPSLIPSRSSLLTPRSWKRIILIS